MGAHVEDTSVIICGGGPTGALLSALLGLANIPNVVLEREDTITTDPRGIALDEDGIRILQSIGIYKDIFSQIGSCMQRFNFVSGTKQDLHHKPLLSIDYNTSEGGTGHVGFICHKQPVLEASIRKIIERSSWSDLRSGCTLTSIVEDQDSVFAEYADSRGQTRRLRGRFLVGADGKTGFVRKKYLEPRGITMDRCEGTSYEEIWVALNWQITLATPKTHPTFPLWSQGYTPSQVYDLFFPQEFRFLCNPNRPAVCGRFGLHTDRLWRFEFLVHKHEDGNTMATQTETDKIILPYITHPGSRYNLPYPVQYPTDCITTLRSRPFNFSARSCNKWALGRVIIAGDAAHVFPPFGGQGIASGFRDASALAWRLQYLVQQPSAPHEKVLRAWYLERKQQLDRSLAATIMNGEYVNEARPLHVFVRDWWLWLQQLVPSQKRWLEQGPRALGMTRYVHAEGLPFLESGGMALPQVYAREGGKGKVVFSDDLLFKDGKRGLFRLLVLPESMEEAEVLVGVLGRVKGCDFVRVEEAVVLVQDMGAELRRVDLGKLTVARVATGEEFAASELCVGRPKPQYYDPLRLRKDLGGAKFVLVRPDRFVYATCSHELNLCQMLESLHSVLLT